MVVYYQFRMVMVFTNDLFLMDVCSYKNNRLCFLKLYKEQWDSFGILISDNLRIDWGYYSISGFYSWSNEEHLVNTNFFWIKYFCYKLDVRLEFFKYFFRRKKSNSKVRRRRRRKYLNLETKVCLSSHGFHIFNVLNIFFGLLNPLCISVSLFLCEGFYNFDLMDSVFPMLSLGLELEFEEEFYLLRYHCLGYRYSLYWLLSSW